MNRSRNFSDTDLSVSTEEFSNDRIRLSCGDSLFLYEKWERPTVIVSDGGYGILGFQGDAENAEGLPAWYEPHIREWAKHALPSTTLWFWNTEVGWATVHPVLEKYGWEYVNCNVWNKGMGHVAGNVNTGTIRRFPVVTELCVQYAYKPTIDGKTLQEWLLSEWKRTGLPFRKANEACGVVDAATRKYFDKGHLWYFPPPKMFAKLCFYANRFGAENGKPYFSRDGKVPMTADEWALMRNKFHCPIGYTNVWNRAPLSGKERIKSPAGKVKAAHLNQKPLDLMRLIIEASTDENDCVWEPFGGLFSASLAAMVLGRKACAAEIDPVYYSLALTRFQNALF